MMGKLCSMFRVLLLAALAALLAQPATTTAAPAGFPFGDETLNYAVKLPGGMSIGTAHLHARRDPARGWMFDFTMDASMPNVPLTDHYASLATADLCGIRWERSSVHGARKVNEFTVVDRARSVAVRATAGGGLTEIPVGSCPRDALTFLFYLRRELGQGRVPPNDTILFGGSYRINMVYTGAVNTTQDSRPSIADQVNCIVKGPASELHLEVVFARDAARTPLVVRCPFALGTLTLELIH
jgi:hypothetical protein